MAVCGVNNGERAGINWTNCNAREHGRHGGSASSPFNASTRLPRSSMANSPGSAGPAEEGWAEGTSGVFLGCSEVDFAGTKTFDHVIVLT